jgi:hypothetical protein
VDLITGERLSTEAAAARRRAGVAGDAGARAQREAGDPTVFFRLGALWCLLLAVSALPIMLQAREACPTPGSALLLQVICALWMVFWIAFGVGVALRDRWMVRAAGFLMSTLWKALVVFVVFSLVGCALSGQIILPGILPLIILMTGPHILDEARRRAGWAG